MKQLKNKVKKIVSNSCDNIIDTFNATVEIIKPLFIGACLFIGVGFIIHHLTASTLQKQNDCAEQICQDSNYTQIASKLLFCHTSQKHYSLTPCNEN